MITITDYENISEVYSKFQPDQSGASPTGRSIPTILEDCQEWAAKGKIGDMNATVYYLLYPWEDAVNMVWDADSVHKIEIIENDEQDDTALQ